MRYSNVGVFNMSLSCIAFTEVNVDCPLDQRTSADKNVNYATNITWPEPVVQGYDGPLDLVSSIQPGLPLGIGNHTVVYTVSKKPIFSTKCNFTISVYGKKSIIIARFQTIYSVLFVNSLIINHLFRNFFNYLCNNASRSTCSWAT